MSRILSRVRVSACTRASRTQGDIHRDIQKQGASLSPALGGPRSRANCHQRPVVAGSIIHGEVLKSLVFETAGPGAIRNSPMRNQTHGDTGHLVAASSPMPPMKKLQCIGPSHIRRASAKKSTTKCHRPPRLTRILISAWNWNNRQAYPKFRNQ